MVSGGSVGETVDGLQEADVAISVYIYIYLCACVNISVNQQQSVARC